MHDIFVQHAERLLYYVFLWIGYFLLVACLALFHIIEIEREGRNVAKQSGSLRGVLRLPWHRERLGVVSLLASLSRHWACAYHRSFLVAS